MKLLLLALLALVTVGCGASPLGPDPTLTAIQTVPGQTPRPSEYHFDGVPLCFRDPAFCS